MKSQNTAQTASAAGRAALVSLYHAREAVRGAKKWEYLETVGHGLFSMGARHSHMIEANHRLQDAEQRVRQFVRALGADEAERGEDPPSSGQKWPTLDHFVDVALDTRLSYAETPKAIEAMLARLQDVIAAVDTAMQTLKR